MISWLPSQAQDFLLAPAKQGPLVPKEVNVGAVYQVIPSQQFDLSHKQIKFKPRPTSKKFAATASIHAELADLEEEWTVINDSITVEIGEAQDSKLGFVLSWSHHTKISCVRQPSS